MMGRTSGVVLARDLKLFVSKYVLNLNDNFLSSLVPGTSMLHSFFFGTGVLVPRKRDKVDEILMIVISHARRLIIFY